MSSATKKNTNSEPKVTIYVRNYAKKAIMLTLPTRVPLSEIRGRVEKKMKVSQEDQILFLHGCIVPSDLEEIELENRLIFHLVNLKRINLDRIWISVKRI